MTETGFKHFYIKRKSTSIIRCMDTREYKTKKTGVNVLIPLSCVLCSKLRAFPVIFDIFPYPCLSFSEVDFYYLVKNELELF